MKNYKKIAVIFLLTLNLSTHVNAKLAQPDFVLYGTATWFGEPLAGGSEITLFLEGQLLTVTKYSMGMDENLGGLYALRVPMDDVDPRQHGKSRPGDPASIFINGNLVAEVLVGDYGTTQRLDLDPLNLAGDTAVINIANASMPEGNIGSSMIGMEISLSDTTDNEVTVTWTTLDGTSFGQENCGFDVDYVNATGTATIAAQTTSTTIQIEICGDTIIEDNETFDVVLSQATNAIIQFDNATATILDDDGAPELRGFDSVVFEPETGFLIQDFQFNLSGSYEQDVSFDFTTIAISATAGVDYIETSGQVVILAGQIQAVVPVEYLADTIAEGIEVINLQISNVTNAQLVTPILTAFIMDANREQQTEQQSEIDNIDVPELISPSDVILSADDKHLYVPSLTGDGSILHFSFDEGNLDFISSINNNIIGFEDTKFKLIRQLALSPNDKFLYAAVGGEDAISAFSVDTNSGELTAIGEISETFIGEFGITEVYDVLISQDGKHLYAAGSGSDSVAVFAIDEVTGALTYSEAEILGVNDPNDSGATVVFMDRPIKLNLSPNGENLYAAAEFSSSIVFFERDTSTGNLNYKQSLKSGIDGVSQIGGAADVLTSNDGSHVYLLGRADNTIAIFNRASNGLLSFNRVLNKTNPDFIGLESPNALINSPADDHLYVLGFNDSTMVTFNRDNQSGGTEFGNLDFADIEQDEVNGVNSLNGPTALDITSDGNWIIVAAGIDNALVVFDTPSNDLIFKDGFD